MSLPLPDTHVRKAVFTALEELVVENKVIPTFDSRTTGENPFFYVLMTTQTNDERKDNKCESRYNSSILLDIITRYDGSGNTGSRLLADTISEEVRKRIENLILATESGLKIFSQRLNFPNDISTITGTTNIFRKLIRIELVIDKL